MVIVVKLKKGKKICRLFSKRGGDGDIVAEGEEEEGETGIERERDRVRGCA